MPQPTSPSRTANALPASLPATLQDLRASKQFNEAYVSRSVKDELRANLIRRLQDQSSGKNTDAIFPGIVGFDDTVVPSSPARTSSCSGCAARPRAASCAHSPDYSIP
jgi:magnesium chelatase subunit I